MHLYSGRKKNVYQGKFIISYSWHSQLGLNRPIFILISGNYRLSQELSAFKMQISRTQYCWRYGLQKKAPILAFFLPRASQFQNIIVHQKFAENISFKFPSRSCNQIQNRSRETKINVDRNFEIRPQLLSSKISRHKRQCP